ncbi:hypothetical protein E1H12_06085 [Geitlerinema sp. P-1104]|uniref:hypothetical protein n=1 Tax=Geitlerinema sp. P-1104 TaxID=2546230 RepID=UPI001476AD39|nr:hypothetical protein [Geitlerinema sp. P-1104]NMG58107.1 hypothetical protein [Geitlerinema sp. P-1104]
MTPEGTWTIADAQTLRGTPYKGTVQISRIGSVYQIFWLSDRSNFSGLGFYHENRLCIGWSLDSSFRVVVYHIQPDGTLEGQWTTPQMFGETGSERASGEPSQEVEGLYQISGTYPKKQPPYTNNMAIGKTGEIYQLSSSGTSKLKGIGLRSGDWFVSNWGYNGNFGVMIYELDEEAALGRWTRPGSDQVGIEKLLKIC